MNILAAAVLACASFPGAHAQSAPDAKAEVVSVAERFIQAQASFDVPALTALTDDTYVEVSPVGDVDPRAKMLGFYAPENKMDGVQDSLDDTSVRFFQDTAIVLGLVHFSYPGKDGKPVASTMRATFVERKTGSAWKLVSTQFTPYRPSGK